MIKPPDTELKVIDGDSIISVNDRKRLSEIQKEYPNMQIIIGKVEDDDLPVSLDLAEMEHSRQEIFDAATETILGKRIDTLYRSRSFPFTGIMMLISFLVGVATCFFVYNI